MYPGGYLRHFNAHTPLIQNCNTSLANLHDLLVTYTRPAAFIVLSVAIFLHRTEMRSPLRVESPEKAAPGPLCNGTPITKLCAA